MILQAVTPPLSANKPPAPMTTIVLHATAGSTARSSIDWLRSQGLGYHFIIARDSKDTASAAKADGSQSIVYHCVSTGHWVSHVGSHIPLPGGHRANRIGIGISLANRQNGEPYTAAQIAALDEVIALVRKQRPSVTHLTTHAVIQPWNRRDPMQIDAKALAKAHGLIWFEPTADQIAAYKPKPIKKPK